MNNPLKHKCFLLGHPDGLSEEPFQTPVQGSRGRCCCVELLRTTFEPKKLPSQVRKGSQERSIPTKTSHTAPSHQGNSANLNSPTTRRPFKRRQDNYSDLGSICIRRYFISLTPPPQTSPSTLLISRVLALTVNTSYI